MNIAEIFNITARDYDATRRKYIACFDDFYGMALDRIPYRKDDHFRVLDLGAGTGLFSAFIKEAYPVCDLTLTDISSGMLAQARERFHGQENVRCVKHDYVQEAIPGRYDVVVSALSLHHAAQEELAAVFGKIYTCLTAGGIFINADQILGPTVEIEAAYARAWLRQAVEQGCSQQEIEVALKRMEADKTLPLSIQLKLLEAQGFQQVNCWYQYYRFAVYTGTRPA